MFWEYEEATGLLLAKRDAATITQKVGRAAEIGSVRVDEYMIVETYATVHHIVSNVTGRLREDVTTWWENAWISAVTVRAGSAQEVVKA